MAQPFFSTRIVQAALCLLLLSGGTVAHAQDPVYRTINNLNGLPSNSVYNILQDKQGFIWLGHDKGLSRYDGTTFKQYLANTQQGRALSNLMEGGGHIWCQDFTGNFYYTKGDSLQRETRMKSTGVYTMAAITRNNLLLSVSWDHFQLLNVETGQLSAASNLEGNGLASFFQQNGLTVKTRNGLNYLDDDPRTFFIGKSNNSSPLFFLQKFGGEYYGFTKNEYPAVYLVKDDKTSPLPLLKPGLFVQDINVIDDLLWVSTSAGAWCFNLEMKPAFDGHCFFAGRSISKIMKDREGNYWFGTLDNGVLFVPDINSRLYKYDNEGITALSVSADSREIFAGTANNRLLVFNDLQKKFTSLYKEPTNHEVLSILEDAKTGNIIFTSDRIVFLYHGQKSKEILTAGKNLVPVNDNWYAMAHSGGLSLMQRGATNNRQIPAWLQQGDSNWINNQYQLIRTATRGRSVVFNSRDSILYGATASGIYYYSPAGSGKILYKGKEIFASQLIISGDSVFAATYTDGLFLITNRSDAQALLSKGKPVSKTIYKIFKSEHWLWLLGDAVLQRYDIDKKEILEFTTADGLPRAEMKDLAVLNSNLYVATTEGLAVLNENSSTENTIAPLLVINKLLVNGMSMDWQQPLTLRNRENSMEIDLSLLSFRGGDSLRIEYKINNAGWQRLSQGARVLNLPSLSSGTYTIQLRGFNEDGIQTVNPATLSFSIAAPFYKQWWFLISMLLLGMAAVYVYFRWRLHTIKRKNELLAQKAQLEQDLQQSLLTSIKSQMNPHFLFNALNTIQSYIYTNDKENASQYLGKFSELTRMILDMSNKDIVPVADEIKALTLYLDLEKLRFEDKLTCELRVDENISTETTYIHSMLIQPYVENAIKHGLLHQKNNWQLLIDFAKTDNGIKVTVDDNGIGRKRSEELNQLKFKKHQSFATSANQKRLEILNKGLREIISLEIIDKKDEQGNAAGTKVVIHIPIVKKGTRQ